jgi:hypothetical protein
MHMSGWDTLEVISDDFRAFLLPLPNIRLNPFSNPRSEPFARSVVASTLLLGFELSTLFLLEGSHLLAVSFCESSRCQFLLYYDLASQEC